MDKAPEMRTAAGRPMLRRRTLIRSLLRILRSNFFARHVTGLSITTARKQARLKKLSIMPCDHPRSGHAMQWRQEYHLARNYPTTRDPRHRSYTFRTPLARSDRLHAQREHDP